MARQKDDKHCEFIRSLPCLCCMDNTMTECCHVRYPDAKAAKPLTGIGIRPDDCFTVPLCNRHHREQHDYGNERLWWVARHIEPIFVGLALYRVSGDYEAGTKIVEAWQ